jgi:predicted O-methyltransferase YrrM
MAETAPPQPSPGAPPQAAPEPARRRNRSEAEAEIRAAAPGIGAAALDALSDMYTASALPGTGGPDPLPIDDTTRIGVAQGAELRRFMREVEATRALEVGLAYGFSTVWMLDALAGRPDARMVSIDPFQFAEWKGIGLRQAARVAGATRHDWIDAFSIIALTDLIRAGDRFDFCFIDGNHRFDDVLVDFYLADQLVRPGGIIALDDMWMPSIRTVAEFVLANRAYERLHQPVRNLAVLRKQRDDDRDWRHFEPFLVHRRSRMNLHRKLIWALSTATRLR